MAFGEIQIPVEADGSFDRERALKELLSSPGGNAFTGVPTDKIVFTDLGSIYKSGDLELDLASERRQGRTLYERDPNSQKPANLHQIAANAVTPDD